MSRYVDIDTLKIPSEEMIANWIVNSAPTIDICFCRECKYCSKDLIKWSEKDENGNWIDTKCNLCGRTKLEVSLDDFCSYGERSRR